MNTFRFAKELREDSDQAYWDFCATNEKLLIILEAEGLPSDLHGYCDKVITLGTALRLLEGTGVMGTEFQA